MIRKCFFLFLLLSTSVLFAQSGKIAGVILDKDTGEPLPGANVVVEGTALGSATDLEGFYYISNVPAGKHTLVFSYIGYEELKMPVEVTEGETKEQDAQLGMQIFEGETVVVTAQMEGQAKAINQQLSSNTIVNIVSSDKIQELPDQNAAESLARLPGIAVERDAGEGQKVIIRGLAPKYNSITVNGERIPSTDPDDRSVDLSLISSDMLAGIEVYKALTPDLDGDAIGGTVNFMIKKAPSGWRGDFRLNGGYNSLAQDFGVYRMRASLSNRFLNNDLGLLITGSINRSNRSSHLLNAGYVSPGVDSQGETIIGVDQLNLAHRDETRDRYGASLTADYNVLNGNIMFNSFWGRTDRDELRRRRRYNIDAWRSEYTLRDRQIQTDLWTNSLTGSHTLENLIVSWRGSYSNTRSETPYSHYARFYELGAFVPELEEDKGPTYIPAGAVNNLDDTFFKHSVINTQMIKDRDATAQLDLKYPFSLSNLFAGYLKIGGKYRNKNRSVDKYELWSNHFGINDLGAESEPGTWKLTSDRKLLLSNFLDPDFEVDKYLDGQYDFGLGLDVDKLNDFYNTYRHYTFENGDPLYVINPLVDVDDYKAAETILAGYLMTELKFGSMFMLIPGVRYEKTTNDYESIFGTPRISEDEQDVFGLTDTTGQSVSEYFLPMLHLRVKPVEWFDVRMAATKTLSRPNYFNLVPFRKIDFDDRAINEGNPNLLPAIAWNYDLYLSFYNKYGLFTIGGFYKEIDGVSYIRSTTIEEGYYNQWGLTSPVNSEYLSKVKGFEIDIQTNLRQLPSPFNGIILYANYARIFSETFFPVERLVGRSGPPFFTPIFVDTVRSGKMPGQTDHLANFTIGYEKGGFTGRLSVFIQPKSLFQVGEIEEEDIYTSSYQRWDLALQQNLGRGFSIFSNINNISNQPEGSYYGQEKFPLEEEFFGWTAELGVRYKL